MTSNIFFPNKALLLAGGLGTRLKPLTNAMPKCLVPIAGQPLLGYWFDLLFKAGLNSVLVNTHYLADQVADFCFHSVWRERIDLVHEVNLLGTCGTLRQNRSYFNNSPFWLIHADNISQFDPVQMWKTHLARPITCIGTMMTFETDNPKQCGIVALNDMGILQNYVEKSPDPPGNLANGAVFILEPKIFTILDRRPAATDFCADIVPELIGQLFTFHNNQFHRDIGTPDSYEQACKSFRI